MVLSYQTYTTDQEEFVKAFEDLHKTIYGEETAETDINQEHFHCGIVTTYAGEPAAVLALYINPLIKFEQLPTMLFGNFEATDDENAVTALFSKARSIARAQQIYQLLGPMNGSTTNSYRLAIPSGPSPFFLEPKQPGYYQNLLHRCGAQRVASYFSAIDHLKKYDAKKVQHSINDLVKKGVTFRQIDLKAFSKELRRLHPFCNSVFGANFLHTPVSETVFTERYKKLRIYIEPGYIILAETQDQQLAGFVFCLPDHGNAGKRGLIIKTLARLPGRNFAGLGTALIGLIRQKAISDDMEYLIHALMHRNNVSLNLSKNFSGSVFREYHLYCCKA